MNNQLLDSKISTVKYVNASINDVKIEVLNKTKGRYNYSGNFNGKSVLISPRFITSLSSRFAMSPQIFNYFSPSELFTRIATKYGKGATVRFAIEMDHNGNQKRLLAISGTEGKIVTYDKAHNFLVEQGGRDISYDGNGRLSAMFRPVGGEQKFQIGGDDFKQQFLCSIPIDSFGSPEIAIAMERMLCLNGLVGLAPCFKAPIKLGTDDPISNLKQAVESYANEEGFEVIQERITTAQKTLASVSEAEMVAKIIEKCSFNVGTGTGILNSFGKMVGDLPNLYGTANLDFFSSRRQSLLPTKCSLYQLLNFISELSSHFAVQQSKTKLMGLAGSILSKDFDLEGFQTGNFKEENNNQALYLDESREIVERKRELIQA